MKGPLILLAVLAGGALFVWLAFFGEQGADVARGIEETDDAFAAIEAELEAVQPTFTFLTSQGRLRLGIKEQRDRVQRDLAALRGDRVAILTDDGLDPRERLPRLRELVDRADQLLAAARIYRLQIEARADFMRDASVLLHEIEGFDTGLAATIAEADASGAPVTEAQRSRHATLAATLIETQQRVRLADQLISENLEQGRLLADQALRALRELRDGLRNLADELGAG